jgi:ubiquinone biosynthesis protein UbiJ
LKLSIEKRHDSRYFCSDNRGEAPRAEDVVLEILKTIQNSIGALDRKVEASVAALDHKVTRQHAILTQDVRMIRAAIHDIGETRVTEGEIVALHEDVNRVQQGRDELTTRVEMLEGPRD